MAGQLLRGGPLLPPVSPSAAGAPPAGDVAGYELLGELGRGGMGVVLKARHRELNRVVALKMILSARFACPQDVLRFRLEAETAARLQHPNIVQLYEVGTHHGQPFMALEYVDGPTLAQQLEAQARANRSRAMPPREAARLIEVLARAVQVAHRHGVVHRDLKPANILVAPDGTLKIADFGLAKQLDGAGAQTETGRILGTPQYMAPEQAAGRVHDIGPATDVYALGAILYELLAGQAPFDSAFSVDTVIQVVTRDPVPVRRLQKGVPRDLETICLKCLEKEPVRRYATAEHLADDLARFRDNRPIRARPVGPLERAWKWARRRPVVAALLLGLVLVSLLGFAGVSAALVYALEGWREADGQRAHAGEQREAAETARQQEAAQRRQAEANVSLARLAQARLEWRLNNVAAAALLLEGVKPEHRGWEWRYVRGLLHADLLTLPDAHDPCAMSVAFSPDGRLLASAGGNPYGDATMVRGEVKLWDADTGKLVRTLTGFRHIVYRVAFSPDGKLLAAVSHDGQVRVWHTADGRSVHTLSVGAPAEDVAFSPDGKRLTAGSHQGCAVVWDLAIGKEVRRLAHGDGQVTRVAFSPDGQHLAVTGEQEIHIWHLGSGRRARRLPAPEAKGLAYSPDGKLLAAATGGRVRLFDTADGRLVQTLTGHTGLVAGLAFGPDGRHLATAGADTTVRLWDVTGGTEEVVWRGHAGRVEAVCFHPCGWRLASAAAQPGDVKVWDLTRHPEHVRVAEPRFERWVEAFGFDAAGNVILQRRGGDVETRDAVTGVLRQRRCLPITDAWVTPANLGALSRNGRLLVAVTRRDPNRVKVWDLETGRELSAISHVARVWHVAISPDGRRVASASWVRKDDRVVGDCLVWDAASGGVLFRRGVRDELTRALRLTADGRNLTQAACRVQVAQERGGWRLNPRESMVRLWQLPASGNAGKPLLSFPLKPDEDASVTFNAAATRLAACTDEGRVLVWELPSGRPLYRHPPRGLINVQDLAFSPDGRLLATLNREQVRVWDVAAGQEVLVLRGAPPRSRDWGFNPRLAWSADGTRLAASNWDHSVSVWEAPAKQPSAAERLRAARARTTSWHLRGATAGLAQKLPATLAIHLRELAKAPNLAADSALARGELFARCGRWDLAAADYARAFAHAETSDAEPWRQHAYLRLRAGDAAGYRRVCAQMLERFGDTADHGTAADVALACVQAPDAVADMGRVLRLAELALKKHPDLAWYRHALALACYRQGNCERAVKEAQAAMEKEPGWGDNHLLNWLTLALALERLGQAREARTWGVKAEIKLAELARAPAVTPGGAGVQALGWCDWLAAERLLAEVRENARRGAR
jgi:WD40 repeat protein/tRNA A-37 threonylcarbamoyl transferase component Bud32